MGRILMEKEGARRGKSAALPARYERRPTARWRDPAARERGRGKERPAYEPGKKRRKKERRREKKATAQTQRAGAGAEGQDQPAGRRAEGWRAGSFPVSRVWGGRGPRKERAARAGGKQREGERERERPMRRLTRRTERSPARGVSEGARAQPREQGWGCRARRGRLYGVHTSYTPSLYQDAVAGPQRHGGPFGQRRSAKQAGSRQGRPSPSSARFLQRASATRQRDRRVLRAYSVHPMHAACVGGRVPVHAHRGRTEGARDSAVAAAGTAGASHPTQARPRIAAASFVDASRSWAGNDAATHTSARRASWSSGRKA